MSFRSPASRSVREGLLFGIPFLILIAGCGGKQAPPPTVSRNTPSPNPVARPASSSSGPSALSVSTPAANAPTGEGPGAEFGQPINRDFPGVVCFRGNAQRNYYGEGPTPRGYLKVLWRNAIPADRAAPQWNGVGWTGQPLAVEWPESTRRHMNFLHQPGPATEIIVGGMDSTVHFYDAETGEPSRKPLRMPIANPIKGTVSVDPRGYPLLYVGAGLSRAKTGYRVFSLTDYRELFLIPGITPGAPRRWPAFDSNGLVVNDRLLLPGENGVFYSTALNTNWNPDTGKISIRPKVSRIPVTSSGIEGSISVWGKYGYCADSDGHLWRFDWQPPLRAKRLRDLGDDADSTPTFDTDGSFYMGIQVDHRSARSAKGTLFKLRQPDGKLIWQWDFTAQTFHGSSKIHDINGGVLSTPAIWPQGGLVFVTTAHHPRMGKGSVVALDRETGKPRWEHPMKGYAWGSPWVCDGAVVVGDSTGRVYVLDANTGETLVKDEAGNPAEGVETKNTIEASPIVWKGRIYMGVRGGALVCIGPADGTAAPEAQSPGE